MLPIIAAVFLVAHAAVHLGFLARPKTTESGASWPFVLDRSWVLGRSGVGGNGARYLGAALVGVVMLGYMVAAVAIVGLAPAQVAGRAVVIGSVASAAVLTLFFHRWLVLGLAIDIALIVLGMSGWPSWE